MNTVLQLSLTALALATAVSWVAFLAGSRLLPSTLWLARLGERMYKQKIAALERPPLSNYKRLVERGEFGAGFAIIAALILAKSFVSGLLGIVVIFYLPLGVFIMPSLAAAHGDDPSMLVWVRWVTVMQSLSHLITAALGFALTVAWIAQDVDFPPLLSANAGVVYGFIAGSVLTGLIAAWLETDGHIRRGYL